MIIEQAFHKISIKNGKARIWLESSRLSDVGLEPGRGYTANVDVEKKRITLESSTIGNVVSSRTRKGKTIPIIDKSGVDIRSALDRCCAIKVTFFKDGDQSRVLIEGVMTTADVLASKEHEEVHKLRSITFCAGAGISSCCAVDSGFEEAAGVEYNPKVGAEDRFADVYKVNHPNSIMFNVPLEEVDANELPAVDCWIAGLDCTDFSTLASTKKEDQIQTKDLYIHLAALFKQRAKDDRPSAILIENVPGFAAEAGSTLKLFFKKEGYHVTDGVLNSLDFGSRTERKRYFFVACTYEGFALPKGTNRKSTPICQDGVITVDSLDWVTPDTDGTLKYFLERNDSITHHHKVQSFDITKDAYIGTIPKSHAKKVPENLIRHPFKRDTFAFLLNVNHLRYLHGICNNVYLGNSRSLQIQSIGQGVCVRTFTAIAKKLHDFLFNNMFKDKAKYKLPEHNDNLHNDHVQLCFGF